VVAQAAGSLADLFAAIASAGHGLFSVDSLALLVEARYCCCLDEATAALLDRADGDAIGALDPTGFRDLSVRIERVVADLERRLASMHFTDPAVYEIDDHRREKWRRQGFAAHGRAASAEQRAESAARDNTQQQSERNWFER
jgi:hypothetical protein